MTYKMKGHELPGPNQKKSPVEKRVYSSDTGFGWIDNIKRKREFKQERNEMQRDIELNKLSELEQSTLNLKGDPDGIHAKDSIAAGTGPMTQGGKWGGSGV